MYLTHTVCRPSITFDCSKCLGPRWSHSGVPPQQSTTQIAFVALYVLCETRNAVYVVSRSPHTETAWGSILPPLFPIHFLLFSSLLLFLILILLKFPIFCPTSQFSDLWEWRLPASWSIKCVTSIVFLNHFNSTTDQTIVDIVFSDLYVSCCV